MSASHHAKLTPLKEANTLTRRTLHRAAFHQCIDRIALEREACEHALRAAQLIYKERDV